MKRSFATIGQAAALAWALWPLAAMASDAAKPTLDLRPPGEATFRATIDGDQVMLGPAKVSRAGVARPEDGEITVSVAPSGMAPWAKVTIMEKTPLPVDFVITGMIDTIKIDEIEICGRTDGEIAAKIAAGSRKLVLNRFAVHPQGASCP